MAYGFVVAGYAGIECIAALEPDSNNVALRMIVSALRAPVDADAVAYYAW